MFASSLLSKKNRFRCLTVGAVFASLAPLAIGCSLTRKPAECTSNAECREAFGTGYICAESKLCEPAPVNVACTAQYPSDLLTAPDKYKDYVVFGSLLRADGKEGARHDSAQLAVEAVNRYLVDQGSARPQLESLRFGLVQCTHDGNVGTISDLAEYLSETVQVPVILGPASSSATKGAFTRLNLAEDGSELRKTLIFSPSATSVALTALEETTPGLLWRTAPTDDGQGKLMGTYALNTGEKFVVFYEDTPYGLGLFDELEKASEGSCDDCGFIFDADTSDPGPLNSVLLADATKAALQDARTVFFMGAQETHLQVMMKGLSTDFADKMLFFSDAAASADTVALAGDNADRVVGTRPRAAEEGEATRFFTAAYQGRHDISPLIHSFTAHTYDAAWLTLIAALRARLEGEPVTGESVGAGLRLLSDPDWTSQSEEECPSKMVNERCPPLTLDETYLDEMLAGFESRGSINVRGASGSLDYDTKTEELIDSADAFEFWYLEQVLDEEIQIIGGTPPAP